MGFLFLLFFDAIAFFGGDVDYFLAKLFNKKVTEHRDIAPERWHRNFIFLQAFIKPDGLAFF